MQVLLRHYCSGNDVFCDISNGLLSVDTLEEAGVTPVSKVRRFYDDLGGNRVGVAALNRRLILLVNGVAYDIVAERVVASVEGHDAHRRLSLTTSTARFEIKYLNDRTPVSTLFYSEDEEDADFGIWVRNVVNLPARQAAFLERWSAA